jgi:hypothetical protein
MEQHSKSAFEAASNTSDPAYRASAATENAARAIHREQLIDAALMDTFPASDPVSPGYFD